jgi:hypothetical protein
MDSLQLWRIAANAFMKQPWTENKEWSSSFRAGSRFNNITWLKIRFL